MKKIILALSLTIAVVGMAFSAVAAKKPIDFRRTLFVPVAQKKLALEAPKGMCFIDKTVPAESALYGFLADPVQKKGDQVVLAVFAPCNSLTNAGNLYGADAPQLNAGVISWLNPAVGETTTLSRADYLDMREASFQQYVESNKDGLQQPDGAARRTENSVYLGMTGEMAAPYRGIQTARVLATTSIRHIPLEVTLNAASKDKSVLAKIYPLVEKFITQQIALNEHK